MSINKLFVPYKIALKLKEKGFDEPCFSNYYKTGELIPYRGYPDEGNEDTNFSTTRNSSKASNIWITAPLYQQVIDWFREKQEIRFKIEPTVKEQVDIFLYQFGSWKWIGKYKSDYEALNKAIEEALKLI